MIIQMGITYYIILILAIIFIFFIINWLYDKHKFHNREFRKKYIDNPQVSDNDFYNNNVLFKINNIPKDYTIRKKIWLCDEILDYPSDRIHPDMIFDEIPSIDSFLNDSELELYDHIKRCGGNPKFFWKGKNVAQVIVDLYKLELNITDELRRESEKRGIVLPEKLPQKNADNASVEGHS